MAIATFLLTSGIAPAGIAVPVFTVAALLSIVVTCYWFLKSGRR
ncbi:hypothetical protein [Amycolatopsis magusensis]|nr:hypothetical protein [Amycolatopsis magusensis]MDI5979871.1 hypothetical protein [Amycolatopsis magusensis]